MEGHVIAGLLDSDLAVLQRELYALCGRFSAVVGVNKAGVAFGNFNVFLCHGNMAYEGISTEGLDNLYAIIQRIGARYPHIEPEARKQLQAQVMTMIRNMDGITVTNASQGETAQDMPLMCHITW